MKSCMNCGGDLPASASAEVRCAHCGMRYQPEELRALEDASRGGVGIGAGGAGIGLGAFFALALLALAGGGVAFVYQRRQAEQALARELVVAEAERDRAEVERERARGRAAAESAERARAQAMLAEGLAEEPEPVEAAAPTEVHAPPRQTLESGATEPSAGAEPAEPAPVEEPERVEAAPGSVEPAAPPSGRLPGLADGPARIRWDTAWGAPRLITIAGREHVYGRLRAFGDDQLYAVAVAAEGARERWRVGPLGTYREGYRWTHLFPAGDRVLVTLADPAVVALAPDTGQAERSWALENPVGELWDAGEGRVGLRIPGDDCRLLDLGAGTLTTIPFNAMPPQPRSHLHQIRRDVPDAKIDGLKIARTLREPGGLAVAAGSAAGTNLPRVVGFDAESGEVRWTWDPAVEAHTGRFRVDDLRGTRYAGVYGTADDRWRLVLIDLETGAPLWDVLLPDIFAVDKADHVLLGEEAVYVLRTSSVDVVRVSDGAYQGAIGTETYEQD